MICLEGMKEPVAEYADNSVYLGKTKIFRIPFFLNLDSLLNRNIAILGMSGSGKSYFLKSLILKMHLNLSANVLIIDWNNEYGKVVDLLDGKVLTLGANLKINIFELYDRSSVKNLGSLAKLMGKYLELSGEESYFLYNKILGNCKRQNGRNYNLTVLMQELGRDSSALAKRISNQLLQLKDNPLFGDSTSFPMDQLLQGVTSLNFSMLKDDAQRSDISAAVIRIIIEIMHRLSLEKGANRTECVLVFDEAWRLIKNSDDIGVLFREGRKYGFCVAAATQLINDINNEILSNVSSLFLFRLQNESDYRPLMENGVIDENEKSIIAGMPVGMCLVSLAKKEDNGVSSKFFLEKIDGIEMDACTLQSGSMKMRISQGLFTESTKKLLVREETKGRILDFALRNNNELQLMGLIKFLLSERLERPEILFYLRNLGLIDLDIVRAYDNVLGEALSEG